MALGALVACDSVPTTTPKPVAPAPAKPSQASESLRNYYAHVQSDLLARGLLRTDGGGPDTPFTPDMLARNFERIAFYDEYALNRGLRASNGRAGTLRRWSGPVRVNVEFGPSVPESIRATDKATVNAYVPRLAKITGHPITMSARRPNFHVLVMSADDNPTIDARLRQIVPGANASTRALFQDVPRNIHCLVAAFSSDNNAGNYTTAIALIRAEHPDLMRKSCIHEEIAQGLGLANDSPEARPSIFNDDDEFAFLTTHDEMLLSMLYDDRLAIGMPLEQARPVIQTLAREQTGRIY
ncbi:DUF2927 domain-containing protein [Shimia aestuarii]|uniref:DUF2927 domain-containing protein n=1 Tax=Shimia aestuarii TaxID=254406 RepID=A0A1I4IYG5_9RHOB|nr:DUF2927 domain-containing protein [Shimia aestuarii]SFL59033.1 Protein of unknown function [Shimia aestuarii]